MYNTTYHSAIGMSSFQALYGCLPPVIPKYQPGATSAVEVDVQLTARDELLRQLKANLQTAQNRIQQFSKSKRRNFQFEEGDWIFLKLQSHIQQSAFKRAFQKLVCCFYGPYKIIQKIGPVAYKLQLPFEARNTQSSMFLCSKRK